MKILVGYKGTDVGKDLMDIAVKHAKAFDGEILVVTSLIGGDKTEQEKIIDALGIHLLFILIFKIFSHLKLMSNNIYRYSKSFDLAPSF